MNILDTIINAQDGAAVRQLGRTVRLGAISRRPPRSRRGAGACRRVATEYAKSGRRGSSGSGARIGPAPNVSRQSRFAGAPLDDRRREQHSGPPARQQGRQSRRCGKRRSADRTESGRPQTDAPYRRRDADGRRVASFQRARHFVSRLERQPRVVADAAARSQWRRVAGGRRHGSDREVLGRAERSARDTKEAACQWRRCPRSARRPRRASRMRFNRGCTERARRCATCEAPGSRSSTCGATKARSRNTR